jgi:Flp pilus assembly protein TadD
LLASLAVTARRAPRCPALAAIEMRPTGSNIIRPPRLLSSAALLLVLAATAGCQTTQSADTTGTLPIATPAQSSGDPRRDVEIYGQQYRADPSKVDAALRYAQALRATGQRAQAVAVLEKASIESPHDKVVLGAYGRALAEAGVYDQALQVLDRAHSPDQPDWHVLSAQGAVLDQMGRHADAQRYYLTALKIAPEEPSVLSNLGLSYALSKNLREAEATLRRASVHTPVDPRVRQNLALVVGLQGRFAEAESIARADLPAEEAAANVAYLRQMLAHRKDPHELNRDARADAGAS